MPSMDWGSSDGCHPQDDDQQLITGQIRAEAGTTFDLPMSGTADDDAYEDNNGDEDDDDVYEDGSTVQAVVCAS